MDLNQFFTTHPRVAVAFSGGVDSAYLLYAAKQSGADVCAYYVQTAFQPQSEQEDAKQLAETLDVPLNILNLDVLAEPQVTANPKNRCYYCKMVIFSAILDRARRDGFSVVLDGTNASDVEADRPGMRALQELSVLSPLRMCGLTKSEIRRRSQAAGLPTWNKPAYACLATRIPTGQVIDARLLARTEAAEAYLFALGFSDFRVRTMGEVAKIQITEHDMPLLVEHRTDIVQHFSQEYEAVWLDLEVRDGVDVQTSA